MIRVVQLVVTYELDDDDDTTAEQLRAEVQQVLPAADVDLVGEEDRPDL